MEGLCFLVLWISWVLVLFWGPGCVLSLMLPDIIEPVFIRRCVQEHNAHRSRASSPAANMRLMTWDDSLGRGARPLGRHCKSSHNPVLQRVGQSHSDFRQVGEHIWFGPPFSAFTIESASHTLNKDGVDYTHRNQSCVRVCGHYTQLMWATSYKFGCAVHVCSKGIDNFSSHPESTLLVCDYADPGNVFGFPPYVVGLACSSCGKEKCQDKTCRYDWSPGWDFGPKSSSHRLHHWLTSTGLQMTVGILWLFYFYAAH
ncbi:glioma pathogenesis-related protein 1b [Hoplias malabaricus]|uniref:glioma pathogenesis-related protein 1b n=1 Tax=Hoplias malabaricus TaxID=27720 RepID=UPI0034627448